MLVTVADPEARTLTLRMRAGKLPLDVVRGDDLRFPVP